MAAKQRSKWFDTFVAGVREPMTWSNIDAYNGADALHLLEGDERTEAEDILFERLAHNDGRAAHALAEIRSTRAIAPLRARLSASVPAMMRVAAALALHQLGDDSGRAAAIDVLRTGSWSEQQSAIAMLGLLGGRDVEQALERALDVADSGVRSASAGTLIRLHGLADYNRSYQDRLGLLQNRLSSPLATVRGDAIAELNEIFARHAHGESPERLGLTWRADDEHGPLLQFSESLRSNAPPYHDDVALDVVERLTGDARRWAEDCLWHFLPSDPRAARAFAHLGVTRAIAPLHEVLQTATGRVASEAAAALRTLEASAGT
jgi:HEAT repeat protein